MKKICIHDRYYLDLKIFNLNYLDTQMLTPLEFIVLEEYVNIYH